MLSMNGAHSLVTMPVVSHNHRRKSGSRRVQVNGRCALMAMQENRDSCNGDVRKAKGNGN